MRALSEMMKWLQGAFAQDYNRRLGREGAFWQRLSPPGEIFLISPN